MAEQINQQPAPDARHRADVGRALQFAMDLLTSVQKRFPAESPDHKALRLAMKAVRVAYYVISGESELVQSSLAVVKAEVNELEKVTQ